MKEHDTVIYNGKEGTIVHVYPDNDTFEVEFQGEVKTLSKSQLKLK